MKRILILFFIMAITAMTDAQSQGKPTAPPAAPAAPARSDAGVEPNIARDVGLRMARVIDSGQAGQLWDSGSPVIKRTVSRNDFVANIAAKRKGFEQPVSREWAAITRQQGGTLPPGKYMSVQFSTAFSGNRTLRELISFRQDEDGTWRFVGYAIQ
jgi:hypothetical protein